MGGVFILNLKIGRVQGKYLQMYSLIISKRRTRSAPITGLTIPRGGVTVGDAIASKFSQCEFDIVVPRKLGAPNNPELAIGAVMQDRTRYLNGRVIQTLQVSAEYLESEIDRQVQEIQRRISLYVLRRNHTTSQADQWLL